MALKATLERSSLGTEQIQTFMRLSVMATLRLMAAADHDLPVMLVMEKLASNPLAGFNALVTAASHDWDLSYDAESLTFTFFNESAGLSMALSVETGEFL